MPILIGLQVGLPNQRGVRKEGISSEAKFPGKPSQNSAQSPAANGAKEEVESLQRSVAPNAHWQKLLTDAFPAASSSVPAPPEADRKNRYRESQEKRVRSVLHFLFPISRLF